MAGTADNFQSLYTSSSPGKLYVDLGGAANGIWDGAANARLLLSTDGSPLLSQNPNARHAGYTAAGCEALIKPTFFFGQADEELDPIVAKATSEEKVISGSMLQIMDINLMEIFNPTAVRSDVNNSQGLTFGSSGVINYTSAAVIWPLEEDSTRFGVFHLYKCFNDAGLALKITQKAMAENPFAFRGMAISTRAAGDRSGRFFKQSVVGS